MEQRHNLKIMGSSQAGGGVYDKVSIMGDGSVHGDVDCRQFSCAGTAHLEGSVKTGVMKIRGTSQVSGSVNVNKLSIQGQVEIRGSMRAAEASIGGMANIGCHLQGERLRLKGSVTVQGDCEFESITANGSLQVEGLLNAGSLDLRLQWPCQAREIGGDTIKIRRGSGLGNLLGFLPGLFNIVPDARMNADLIEGDYVELEHTTARVVRGNDVVIGPGCEIGQIEYRRQLHRHPDSTVHHVIQL
ncbi:polymer-forming cytoskeletal protein [Paenibacillus popilliae]|uniref:Integral membrane protein n=1 Tax=Paenibacillus popilliae ATCC 14706 TaxID=1212764 RepID=M9M294_PAEPP|nr:polymer-forming cytoskeletal protein [Paenibacillus popilliae]GAC43069.1 integral membrane protein [Paenibacillus popilliae ATCC 14706]